MQLRIPGIFCITPAAAEVTTAYPDKVGSPACIPAFSLYRVKLLHQGEAEAVTLFVPILHLCFSP
jgi:hypothetical protein